MLAKQIADALNSHNIPVINRIGTIGGGQDLELGVQVHASEEDLEMASCLTAALNDIGHLNATLNQAYHPSNYNIVGGTTIFNGAPTGRQAPLVPAGPAKPGTPIIILVGVKPYHLNRKSVTQ